MRNHVTCHMQGVGGLCALWSLGDCITSLSEEAPLARWLKQQNVSSRSCGAWKSEIKGELGGFPLRPLVLACRRLSFPRACTQPVSVHGCDLTPPYKDLSRVG